MRFCNNCGTQITDENQRFCHECGAEISVEIPVQQPKQQPSMSQQQPVVQAEPVVESTPVVEAEEIVVDTGDTPMNWHNFLSKQLMFAASAILIIIGILMWTGGIYQHVIFRMSDEGKFARIALNFVQGGYNDAIENPSGFVDELPQVQAMMGMSVQGGAFGQMAMQGMNSESSRNNPLMQVDQQGKQVAAAIDAADVSFTSDYLYEQFGFMQFVDIVFGLIMVALGVAAAYIALMLSKFRRMADKYFYYYNCAVLGSVALYAILYNFALSPFSDVFEIFTLPFFVIVLGLVASLVYNKLYYSKRAHFFVR